MYMNKSTVNNEVNAYQNIAMTVTLLHVYIISHVNMKLSTVQNREFCLSISTSENTSRFKVPLWKGRNETVHYTIIHYMKTNHPTLCYIHFRAAVTAMSVPHQDVSHICIDIFAEGIAEV